MAHDRFLGGKSVDQEMILLSARAVSCVVIITYISPAVFSLHVTSVSFHPLTRPDNTCSSQVWCIALDTSLLDVA